MSSTRPPLIGRDEEFARVETAVDRVVRGSGGLLLVSGEPGVGKTRLVEELAAFAQAQGALIVAGQVDDVDGAPPYWPWLQVLEGVLDAMAPDAAVAALGDGAGPIAAILPAVAHRLTEVPPMAVLDAPQARFRLHDSIARLLVRAAAEAPLVVVLEDLHWADVSSLELTRFVAQRIADAPVLLVVTYRDVDGGVSEPFDDVLAALARRRALERIALTGLSVPEGGRFMSQMIGVRPRSALVADVHARTEGNPFFVGELARLLHSEGRLDRAGAAPEDPVPVGVRDVVRRRLGRLSARTNDALVLAAVLGREFDVVVLAAVADRPLGDAVDMLESALGAGVVEDPQTRPGHLRFSHALIRDTIYGGLSPLRRATLHGRIGEVLERGDVSRRWHSQTLRITCAGR